METTYLKNISHLIEISHEIITVLTLYVNCSRAKRKFSKLYVPMSGLLKQGLQEENIQRYKGVEINQSITLLDFEIA